MLALSFWGNIPSRRISGPIGKPNAAEVSQSEIPSIADTLGRRVCRGYLPLFSVSRSARWCKRSMDYPLMVAAGAGPLETAW